MKIGLEATRANKEHKTGTEWYAWHLLQEFKKLDQTNQFIVYYKQALAGDLGKGPANFYFKRLAWPYHKLWTHLRLSFELLFDKVDRFFASNALPLLVRGQVIVTIHDLGFLKNPELYHPLERIYQKLSHRWSVMRADKIIVPSLAVKSDVEYFYPQTKNKIRVIYHGYDAQDFHRISKTEQEDIKEKFDLPANFILYIGRLEIKKNIPNLIAAYKLLENNDWPLVLAGRWGNFGRKEIEALLTPEYKDKIILLGYVSQKNYSQLMAAASLFVFPSKFEGFGIPILEAMACGTPVLCSDLPVLKEVAANAAMYCNPDDINDIKNKLAQFIANPELKILFKHLGLHRVENFSWEKSAQETLKYILE